VIQKWATLSDDGKYRYDLGRAWGKGESQVVWVLLNPSTADAEKDDMTVSKCVGFSKRWGYDAMIIVNLYAYRATKPEVLLEVEDPFGPANYSSVKRRIGDADLLVLGWSGAIEKVNPSTRHWSKTLSRYNVEQVAKDNGLTPMCLGRTGLGHPRHPSRLGYDTPLEVW
jgi:hypothetical protein